MTHAQLLKDEYSLFPSVISPSEVGSTLTKLEGLQRLVMLDRYSLRDNTLTTLKKGDTVVLTVKDDPKFPMQGYGVVTDIEGDKVTVRVEYPDFVEGVDLSAVTRHKSTIIKPLEIYWEQIAFRVARAVASVETTREKRRYWFKKFYWMLKNMYAIPGGRILYGAGSDAGVTLFNCFVLPNMRDSRGGIIEHIGVATEIMSRGGGVGSNISTLRPAKAPVEGVNGFSSGAVSWGGYLSNLTPLIIQGGSRRGAQMIAMYDWHPDVVEFILCKIQNPWILDKIIREVPDDYIRSRAEYFLVRDADGTPKGVRDSNFMTGANISVLVSNDFMQAVVSGGYWHLRYPDLERFTPEQKKFYNDYWHEIGDVRKWEEQGLPVKVYHTLKAEVLWDLINICARYSAEPGVIFIDNCNNMSNSWYYAPLLVTNPCGEQPLPKYGVCNLIAINLAKMYDEAKHDVAWELLEEVSRVSQRFADNVIDLSPYFLEENEKMAKGERRVGKGEMGLADLMIKLELPYGSEEMLRKTDEIFRFIAVTSYLESCNLAEEKGSFPFFDREKYLQSGFVKTLPEEVKAEIRKKGIRNVCSLTIAPTGSTGTMVGVSTGVEPYFAFKYYRSGRLGKFIPVDTPIAQEYKEKHGVDELPAWFVSAQDLTPMEHVRVQATIQRWVDSAISKTCNAPSTFTVEDNKRLYMEAWRLGCKGVTVYVDGSRDTQVLSVKAEEPTMDVAPVEEEVKVEVTANVESESKVAVAVGVREMTDAELTTDTRVCKISFDETGNMIKECS